MWFLYLLCWQQLLDVVKINNVVFFSLTLPCCVLFEMLVSVCVLLITQSRATDDSGLQGREGIFREQNKEINSKQPSPVWEILQDRGNEGFSVLSIYFIGGVLTRICFIKIWSEDGSSSDFLLCLSFCYLFAYFLLAEDNVWF